MSTKKILRQCSNFANEAYTNNLTSLENSSLIENKDTDAQIHIGKEKHILFIVGRGTSNLTDACHDIKIWRRKCEFLNNTLIHSGFLEQYESIRNSLFEKVNELKTDIKTIVCTGHSLGSSLATLAALDIQLQNKDINVECITFASPRVGSKSFAKLFNKTINKSYRYVFHRDPVAFIPVCVRFRHVKGLIHLKKNGKTVISEDYFFPIGCMVSHHFMDNYKERIHKILDENTNPLFQY